MKNVLRVLKRDILRLVKVPPALVVILALIVLPSLYTWYNVLGFWDPYESTGKLSVCVVNEDKGASSELTGEIDVGQMIVDELHDNHQLDWRFVSYEEAMDQVHAGESYAAYVIPEDFSEKLLTITTGDFEKPDIDYFVNEKKGPIAPKITDTGANTLDDRINAAFVETVTLKVTEALDAAIQQSDERLFDARSVATQRVREAEEGLAQASSSLGDLAARAQEARDRAEQAKASLDVARSSIDSASDAMDSVASLASTLQGDYMKFAATSVPLITGAMEDAADAYARAARAVADLPTIDDDTRQLLETLRASADAAQADAARYSRVLSDEVAPVLGERLGSLAAAAAKAAGTIAGQRVVIAQAELVMNDMIATLDSSVNSLDATRDLVEGLADELDTIETDTMMIAGSELISKILGEGSFNAETIAEFVSAPTELVTEQLYPTDTYGAAMAPLFMNLTFWIGAFMLVVVLRQEVDATGIKNLTLAQRYVSRFLLYAILVILQATVCCAGLPLVGVHIVNLPALFFAAIVAALAYLSIIYSLSVTLQHVGKGICIALVFAQIPAATGLYPIEMTSSFFQFIYPVFPFTYGISAMRESICGFYGFHYLHDILILLGFFAAFMAVGILLRPLLSNVNRMFARQIKASGIYNGENSEVPVRRFRGTQVLRALVDRKKYREIIMHRYEVFQRVYPKLIRGAIIGGIAVPILVTVIFSLGLTGKVVLLTLWLAWIALVFLFLIVIESLRLSFSRQLRLDKMSDDELSSLYLSRDATEDASVVHTVRKGSGSPDSASSSDPSDPSEGDVHE